LSLLFHTLPSDVLVGLAVGPVGEDGGADVRLVQRRDGIKRESWLPEVEPVGLKVAVVGVGEASSCAQNPFTIEVADAMSVWRVVHPVAATEEAADTAAGN
jgi:hypothetical protein